MNERPLKLDLKDVFPGAITAKSVKISGGDETIEDLTPARRCIVIVAIDDSKILSLLHQNDKNTNPKSFASETIKGLKSFYSGQFRVILVGGDEAINQDHINEMITALEEDAEIIFSKDNCDVSGNWARTVQATATGVNITRTKRSWGKPEMKHISFP